MIGVAYIPKDVDIIPEILKPLKEKPRKKVTGTDLVYDAPKIMDHCGSDIAGHFMTGIDDLTNNYVSDCSKAFCGWLRRVRGMSDEDIKLRCKEKRKCRPLDLMALKKMEVEHMSNALSAILHIHQNVNLQLPPNFFQAVRNPETEQVLRTWFPDTLPEAQKGYNQVEIMNAVDKNKFEPFRQAMSLLVMIDEEFINDLSDPSPERLRDVRKKLNYIYTWGEGSLYKHVIKRTLTTLLHEPLMQKGGDLKLEDLEESKRTAFANLLTVARDDFEHILPDIDALADSEIMQLVVRTNASAFKIIDILFNEGIKSPKFDDEMKKYYGEIALSKDLVKSKKNFFELAQTFKGKFTEALPQDYSKLSSATMKTIVSQVEASVGAKAAEELHDAYDSISCQLSLGFGMIPEHKDKPDLQSLFFLHNRASVVCAVFYYIFLHFLEHPDATKEHYDGLMDNWKKAVTTYHTIFADNPSNATPAFFQYEKYMEKVKEIAVLSFANKVLMDEGKRVETLKSYQERLELFELETLVDTVTEADILTFARTYIPIAERQVASTGDASNNEQSKKKKTAKFKKSGIKTKSSPTSRNH